MRKQKTSTEGKSVELDARFGIFSFFTGAGFLDLGFEDAGFVPVLANGICDVAASFNQSEMA